MRGININVSFADDSLKTNDESNMKISYVKELDMIGYAGKLTCQLEESFT